MCPSSHPCLLHPQPHITGEGQTSGQTHGRCFLVSLLCALMAFALLVNYVLASSDSFQSLNVLVVSLFFIFFFLWALLSL